MQGRFKLKVLRSRPVRIRMTEADPHYEERLETLLTVRGSMQDHELIEALRVLRGRLSEQGPVEVTWTGHIVLD